MITPKLTHSKTIRYLLLVILWLVLGFFFVIQQYIYSASNENPFNWFNNLTYRMPTYLLWALFTPIIFTIVNRLAFTKKTLFKNIIILSVCGLLISLLHRFLSIFTTFYIRDIYGALQNSLSESLINARFAIFGGSFDSLFTYLLILSVVIGIIYYKRLRETEQLSAQLETKLAEAKLDSLKSQLHPHFLFNTLHAIGTLMHRDVDAAEKTLILLSDLLRLSLDHLDKQKIKLKDEIQFLEKYLDIQRVRFYDKLNVKINVNPSLFDLMVPSFILQPIVENSIKYAVEPSSTVEKIIVAAELQKNILTIRVTDSGPGINENFTESIGVGNTRSRLQHLYKDLFELNFKNNIDSGLTVTIKIPAEQ